LASLLKVKGSHRSLGTQSLVTEGKKEKRRKKKRRGEYSRTSRRGKRGQGRGKKKKKKKSFQCSSSMFASIGSESGLEDVEGTERGGEGRGEERKGKVAAYFT